MTHFKRPAALPLVLALAAFATATPGKAADAQNAATANNSAYLFNVDHGSGQVTFDAIGRPSMLKIHGKGEAPKGALHVGADRKVTGALTFVLESLETGISMRDRHMKEKYLEVGKFPQAKITITELLLPENYLDASFSKEVPFKGTLALHGVEKPVEGTVQLDHKADSFAIEAKFTIKTTDFAIARPSFAGVTMAEDVNVNAQLTAPIQRE